MGKIISLYRTEDPVVNGAFENTVVKLNIYNVRKGYKIFAICGCEPRVGTTTISVELALALADAGSKTILIDVNFRRKNTYKRLAEETNLGFVDYVEGRAALEDVIYDTGCSNLNYLPCGRVSDEDSPKMLHSSEINTLLQELKESYDFILIDVPAISTSLNALTFAYKADAFILVAAMDGSKKKNLNLAKEKLENGGANLIGVIENKVSIEEYKQYAKDFDYFDNGKYISSAKKAIARKGKDK